ncbi:MAG: hypothetical protein PHU01_11375, partial [Desulfuromonadaceae bacterium]|nr:hypothetical protein [Desulfuromonadaceae bacterium]
MNSRIIAGLNTFFIMFTLLVGLAMPNEAVAVPQVPTGPRTLGLDTVVTDPVPDYYTTPNWANSPPIAKFVDTL